MTGEIGDFIMISISTCVVGIYIPSLYYSGYFLETYL